MLKTSSLIISSKSNVTTMKKIAEGGITRFLEESPKLIYSEYIKKRDVNFFNRNITSLLLKPC